MPASSGGHTNNLVGGLFGVNTSYRIDGHWSTAWLSVIHLIDISLLLLYLKEKWLFFYIIIIATTYMVILWLLSILLLSVLSLLTSLLLLLLELLCRIYNYDFVYNIVEHVTSMLRTFHVALSRKCKCLTIVKITQDIN